jgi:hypothetical protein
MARRLMYMLTGRIFSTEIWGAAYREIANIAWSTVVDASDKTVPNAKDTIMEQASRQI